MSNKPVLSMIALVALAACSGGSVTPTTALPSAAVSPQVSAAPSVAVATPAVTPQVTPVETPSSFTSPLYGYTITLPAGWRAGAAIFRWDGRSAVAHEDPEADRFGGPPSASAWVVAAPVTIKLAAFVQDAIQANARDHGDTCPAPPEVNEPIEIGGQPGVFLAWNCGILINQAITIHDGVAFIMTMRDREVQAATDPEDRAILESLLDSVTFAD